MMISDQYHNYYIALQIYTGYLDSLDNMIVFVLSQQYHNNERPDVGIPLASILNEFMEVIHPI